MTKKTGNKIEVFSKKKKKVIFEYLNVPEITDEALEMAKIESVLNERPEFMTLEAIQDTCKEFDKYFTLIITDVGNSQI